MLRIQSISFHAFPTGSLSCSPLFLFSTPVTPPPGKAPSLVLRPLGKRPVTFCAHWRRRARPDASLGGTSSGRPSYPRLFYAHRMGGPVFLYAPPYRLTPKAGSLFSRRTPGYKGGPAFLVPIGSTAPLRGFSHLVCLLLIRSFCITNLCTQWPNVLCSLSTDECTYLRLSNASLLSDQFIVAAQC